GIVGNADNGDVFLVQGLCKDRGWTGDAGGTLAESGAEGLRRGPPGSDESWRMSQDTIIGRVGAAAEGLFDENIRHDRPSNGAIPFNRSAAPGATERGRRASLAILAEHVPPAATPGCPRA